MADDTQTNPPLAQTEPTESTDASLPSSLLSQLPQFQKTEEESTVEPPAEPPAENPEPTPPPPPPPKKSSSKILVGLLLFFLLAGGLLAGLFGVRYTQELRKKAYVAPGWGPSRDSCGLVEVTANELTPCPGLPVSFVNGQLVPTTNKTNNISTYANVYHIKNVSGQSGKCTGCAESSSCHEFDGDLNRCRNTHGCVEDFGKCSGDYCTLNCNVNPAQANCQQNPNCSWTATPITVHYYTQTDYCTDPFGEPRGTEGAIWCTKNNRMYPHEVSLQAGQMVDIPVQATSLSGQACGSWQLDLEITDINGNSSCKFGGTAAWGMCQTGITCQTTPSPTPTSTPTPSVTPNTTPTPTLTPTGTPTPTATTTPTPTPTPTITPTPTPRAGCNDNCTSDSSCLSGLTCSSGFCRNPSCTGSTNCTCTLPTPTPEIPVSGSGPSVLGASTIVGGILLLLLGLAL